MLLQRRNGRLVLRHQFVLVVPGVSHVPLLHSGRPSRHGARRETVSPLGQQRPAIRPAIPLRYLPTSGMTAAASCLPHAACVICSLPFAARPESFEECPMRFALLGFPFVASCRLRAARCCSIRCLPPPLRARLLVRVGFPFVASCPLSFWRSALRALLASRRRDRQAGRQPHDGHSALSPRAPLFSTSHSSTARFDRTHPHC